MDRLGYQRTIYATSTLNKWMMQVLIYMATHCADDLTIQRSKCTAKRLGARLQCSDPVICQAVNALKKAKLLTTTNRRRRVHYVLPTETQLANYMPR